MTTHPFCGPSVVCRAGNMVCGMLRGPSEEAGVEVVGEPVRADEALNGE